MAATVQHRDVMIVAVLLVFIGLANSVTVTPARVTQFTFYPVAEPATLTVSQHLPVGSSVSFRCRAEYNSSRTPSVRLRKTVNRIPFELATNEYVNVDGLPPVLADRISALIIDNNPNGVDVYQWNIASLTSSDTGNYSCYVGTGLNASTSTVFLNVTAEPQVLSLYLNNELQTQSLPGAANKKLFDINKVYNVSCVASGGNPFPNVTIYSGSKLLTPISITYNTTVSSPDVLGVVTRSTLVNVSITMNVSHIGVPITCFAGLANPNGTSNAIIPISESVVPHFQCQDKFLYQSKQSSISLSCKFIGTNVTTHTVRWRNATANMTIVGKHNVDIQAPGDSRYSLRVSPPQGNDVWSSMTLTINNANSINDLTSNRYFFVANSNLGQAVHEVSVQATGLDGQQQKPGVSAGLQLSAQFGSLVVLVCIAMASVFGRP